MQAAAAHTLILYYDRLEVWRSSEHVGFDQRSSSTSGPVSTEMGDRVRGKFPVPDTYFGMQPTSQPRPKLSLPSLRGR